jgi:hypothetical protein
MWSRTTQKMTRPIFPSVRSLRTSHSPFPRLRQYGIPIGQPKLDFLHIPTDQMAIFGRESFDPFPHGLIATGRFIEECRELLGTVNHRLLCPNWHILSSVHPGGHRGFLHRSRGFRCDQRALYAPLAGVYQSLLVFFCGVAAFLGGGPDFGAGASNALSMPSNCSRKSSLIGFGGSSIAKPRR